MKVIYFLFFCLLHLFTFQYLYGACSVPGPITGSSLVCVGDSILLNDGTIGGSWSSLNTSIGKVSQTGYVTGLSSGIVTIVYSTGVGCDVTKFISVNPLPVISVSLASSSVCSGSSNTLIASSGTAIAYTWSPSTGLSATTGDAVAVTRTVSATAAYTYTLIGTDGNGCANSATLTYNINSLPTVTAAPAAPAICSGFANTLIVSGSAISYEWSPSVSLSATTGNFVTATKSVSIISPFTYIVTGTDVNGCINTAVITYTVYPLPVIFTAPSSPTICSGSANVLIAAGTGGTTFTWSPAIGLSATTGNAVTATRTVSTVSSFSYLVFGTDVNGCANSSIITYTVNPLPTISITAKPSVCSGFPDTLAASGNATDYTWEPPLGLSATTGNSVTAIRKVSVESLFTHSVIGTDGNGCISTATVTYTVNPLPIVTTTNKQICSGGYLAISLSANIPSFYRWGATPNLFVRGATISAVTDQITDTLVLLEDSVTIVQTYTVVPVSTITGCMGDTNKINAYVSPIPNLIVTRDTICSATPLRYYLQCSIKDPGGCISTIIRPNLSNGITIVPQGTVDSILDLISTSTSKTSIDSVTYTCILQSTSSGCTDSVPLIIVINPTPAVPVIDSFDNFICYIPPCKGTKHINFGTKDAPPNGIRYLWSSLGDDIESSAASQFCTISFNYIGIHNIALSAYVNGFNCISSSKPIVRNVVNSIDTDSIALYYNYDNATFIYPNAAVRVVLDTLSAEYRSYLWGWDAQDLKPHPQYNETSQVWVRDSVDTITSKYWVIIIDSATGCPQKKYYGQDAIGNPKANKISMKCHPNPTSNNVVCDIDIEKNGLEVRVLDISGRTVAIQAVTAPTLDLSFLTLPKGSYLINLYDKNILHQTCKIIKE